MFAYLQLGHSYIRIHLRKTLSNWAFWGEYHAQREGTQDAQEAQEGEDVSFLRLLCFLCSFPSLSVYFAEQGVGFQPALLASFLKSVVLMEGRAK